MALSPASIRNVMADLEHSGLIFAPHTSAGRLPTELGLRFFVDAMLELGDVSQDEQARIEAQMRAAASGHTSIPPWPRPRPCCRASRGGRVVLTTKANVNLKHIEFVRLDPARALVILVSDDGSVENRIVDLPPGLRRVRFRRPRTSSTRACRAAPWGRCAPRSRPAARP